MAEKKRKLLAQRAAALINIRTKTVLINISALIIGFISGSSISSEIINIKQLSNNEIDDLADEKAYKKFKRAITNYKEFGKQKSEINEYLIKYIDPKLHFLITEKNILYKKFKVVADYIKLNLKKYRQFLLEKYRIL